MANNKKFIIKTSQHWQRRLIHISMLLIPIIYYGFGANIAAWIHLSLNTILCFIAFFVVLFEAIRIHQGWLFYGQRIYEKHLPSAFFWSSLGIILVLLVADDNQNGGASIAVPIIASLCIGDPLLGECRRAGLSTLAGSIYTYIALLLIWLACSLGLNTPLYYSPFMPLLAIIAEKPSLKWIDDNFMMLIVPLMGVLLTQFIIH